MRYTTKFKRLLSGVLSVIMTIGTVPITSIHAEESTEPYPYTMFAASSDEGAITVNAGNFCINGDVATNGTIVSSGNMNINGTRTEHANESMLYVLKKLDYSYFSGENVTTYTEDYIYEDLNININNPIDVDGSIDLTGSINLNSGIKAVDDVTINGEVKNSNNAVICSETGDINIETSNVSFNGLIYAPYGDIVIDSDNLNLNNVVIIGQTITIDCPNVNSNYNSSMANFIGNQSDIDVALYAMGIYNADANAIDIEWFTNYINSSYEVFYSDDNENYTSVAVVSDATSYQYPITDGFEKRYFKVSLTTNYSEVIESIPIVVTRTEDGYAADFIDTDEDGLPDVVEDIIGTDTNAVDTDEDGLSDYQEFHITRTDPLIFDSVTNGVSDALADSDEDGINNIDEINIGTDPLSPDTDEDGLSDYDEVNVYHTDVKNPDSDNDQLTDGSEIKLGLDPLNPKTFGIPDAEYQIEQTISANSPVMREINTTENAYELSIGMKTNGDAENAVTVTQSSYAHTIQNDAMIGSSADIFISNACNPEEIVLKYKVKDAYIDNTLNMYSSLEEFQGINRLNVFRFYEDTNMLLPINTEFDAENGLLYAEVDALGTYCLMDMEIWLNNLGVTLAAPADHETDNVSSPRNAPKKASTKSDLTYVNAPIDLVFILQTAGTSLEYFEKEKTLIKEFSQYVISDNSDVNIYVITYDKTSGNILKDAFGNYPFQSVSELTTSLNRVSYTSGVYEYCDRGQAFQLLLNTVQLRENADTYVYQFINGANISRTGSDNSQVIDKVKAHILTAYSEISMPGWHYDSTSDQIRISNDIENNGDLFLSFDSDTLNQVQEHFEGKKSKQRAVYEILLPTSWKTVLLDGEISPDNGMDTDKDTLTDWEETDVDRLIWNGDTYTFPTLDVKNHLATLAKFQQSSCFNLLNTIETKRYLPILSDPTVKDTDGDQIDDNRDNLRMVKADSRFSLSDQDSYDTVPEFDFVTERWVESEKNYNSLPILDVTGHMADKSVIRIQLFLDVLLFCNAQAGIADGGISTATSFLCSTILANLNKQDSFSGVLIYAARAMELYFLGTGMPKHYNQEEICDLILSSQNNIDHMMYNFTKAMVYAEQVACEDESTFFTSTSDSGFKFTCFDDKGHNCLIKGYEPYTHNDVPSILPNGHESNKYLNSRHIDWHNTIGESFGGINAEVMRNGDVYTMKYRYYLSDIYEWIPNGLDDIGTYLYPFHKLGIAKQYLMDGYYEGEITWNTGESACDHDIYYQIMDQMRSILGAYADCYYEGDNYYNKMISGKGYEYRSK